MEKRVGSGRRKVSGRERERKGRKGGKEGRREGRSEGGRKEKNWERDNNETLGEDFGINCTCIEVWDAIQHTERTCSVALRHL